MIEESMTSGRLVRPWTSRTAWAMSSASSARGAPMFTSSTMAPPATCCATSVSTRDRSPVRSSAWNALRPVGLIRSPMMQNGWPGPITACLLAEERTVSTPAAYAGSAARRRWISSLARTTAAEASAAYPSAPTTSAYSWVTGAPPTMTATLSRRPALFRALMLALNIGIVVVRNAEKPTMSGWYSTTASTNFSGATWTPRSITWNPAPSNMMFTKFLPMSCTSPLTVPITTVPIDSAPVSASSGRSISSAPAIALPAISISGTKKSPRSNRAPTSSSEGISASYSRVSGPRPAASPALVSSSTAGRFPTRVSSYSWRSSSSFVIGAPSVWLKLAVGAWSGRSGSCRGACFVVAEPRRPAKHGREGVGNPDTFGRGGRDQVRGQPGRRSRDRDSGDGRQAPGENRGRDGHQPGLELLLRDREAAQADRGKLGLQGCPRRDRASGSGLERLARHGGRSEREQDLAQRRAVQRDGQAEVDGLRGLLAQPGQERLRDSHQVGAGRSPPGVPDEQLPWPEAAVAVAPHELMPFERRKQPRRRRLGEAAGSSQLGEADGLIAVHHLGE